MARSERVYTNHKGSVQASYGIPRLTGFVSSVRNEAMTLLAPSAFTAHAAASRGATAGVFFTYFYYGTARAVSD